MSEITITIPEEKLREAISKGIDNVLKSDYGNPVREIIEKSIKDQNGPIKAFVDQLVLDAVTNPDFKERMSSVVVNKLVEAALKR